MTTLLVLAVCYSVAVTWLLIIALGGNHAVAQALRDERDENKCLRTINKALIASSGLSATEIVDATTPLHDAIVCEQLEREFDQ